MYSTETKIDRPEMLYPNRKPVGLIKADRENKFGAIMRGAFVNDRRDIVTNGDADDIGGCLIDGDAVFNSSTKYLVMPEDFFGFNAGEDFTVFMSANFGTAGGWWYGFSAGVTGLSVGKVSGRFAGILNNTRIISNASYYSGSTVNLGITRSNGLFRLYVDGVAQSQTLTNNDACGFGTALVGAEKVNAGFFSGTIYTIQVMTKALDGDELEQLSYDMYQGFRPA